MATISVFGTSRAGIHDTAYRDAEAVGYELAKAGYTVMTGGYAGVMEAASKGAADAGGHVIGVTSAQMEQLRPGVCNAWVTEEIPFPKMEERLNYLVKQADGYVVMDGGVGTLNELVLAWEYMRVREIPVRPLICYGELWRATLTVFMDDRYVPEAHQNMITFASTPSEVIQQLQEKGL